MSDTQREAAALVAMVLVILPTLVLLWLAIAVLGDAPLGDRQPGELALGVAASGGAASTALKALPMLIAAGLSFVIPKSGADWRFIVTVVALLIGLVCAVYLYFSFQQSETAWRMWSYSTVAQIQSPDDLHKALDGKLLAFGAWYVVTLGAQVGIKLT